MRYLAVNSTEVLRCNTVNSPLTTWLKKENINERIGSVQFEREVLRKPALHIARPLVLDSIFEIKIDNDN